MRLHKKLALIRHQKGLKQTEMAKKVNMTTDGYAKLERGERQLKIPRLEQIAAALEMDLKEFLEVDENMVLNASFHHVETCQHQNFYLNPAKEMIPELETSRLTVEQKESENGLLKEQVSQLKEQVSQLKQIIELMKK